MEVGFRPPKAIRIEFFHNGKPVEASSRPLSINLRESWLLKVLPYNVDVAAPWLQISTIAMEQGRTEFDPSLWRINSIVDKFSGLIGKRDKIGNSFLSAPLSIFHKEFLSKVQDIGFSTRQSQTPTFLPDVDDLKNGFKRLTFHLAGLNRTDLRDSRGSGLVDKIQLIWGGLETTEGTSQLVGRVYLYPKDEPFWI